MKTENILSIEESSENRINLVRDRLFWQAWNKSAFLFSVHIKSYLVHKRFVQKVSQDVAWLGFPSSALAAIQKIATDKGFGFEQKSTDHIIINAVPQTTGYEEWWAGIVKKKPKPAEFSIKRTRKTGAKSAKLFGVIGESSLMDNETIFKISISEPSPKGCLCNFLYYRVTSRC